MSRVQDHLRKTLLAGLFAAIPLGITGLVAWWIDTKTRPLSHLLFGVDTPVVGILVAVALVYVLGLVVTSLLGRLILRLADRVLSRLPVLRPIYSAWKQVLVTPGGGADGVFSRVVLVGDEIGWTLGFTTGRTLAGDPASYCVFVPTAPNPTSGRLYFVRRDKIRFIDLSTEEAFKLILSGGNYVPLQVGLQTAAPSLIDAPAAAPVAAEQPLADPYAT